MPDLILPEFITIERLLETGDLEQAASLIADLERDLALSDDERFKCRLLKCKLLTKQSKYEDVFQLAEALYLAEKDHPVSLPRLDALFTMIEALWFSGKLDEAINLVKKAEQELPALENASLRDVTLRQASLFNQKGLIHYYQGNYDACLVCFLQSLELFRTLGDKKALSHSLNNLGVIYWTKGDLNPALTYLEESLGISEELGIKSIIPNALNNLGNVYREKGELSRALDYYVRSLAAFQQIGNKREIARGYKNIGVVYYEKGDLVHSLEYSKQSLQLREELGNRVEIADTLSHLVVLSSDKGSLTQAQTYLKQLESLKEIEPTPMLEESCKMARVYCLKTAEAFTGTLSFDALHQMLKKYIMAQDLLYELIDQQVNPVEALQNLCELLILEFKTFGDEQILVEVNQLTARLIQIGQKQQMYSLLAKTYFLQAKLALLEVDADRARHLLHEAHEIAIKKGYERLTMVIASEEKRLAGELPSWFQDENVSLLDRLGQLGIDNLVVALRQNRVEAFSLDNLQVTPSMQELQSFVSQLSKRYTEW